MARYYYLSKEGFDRLTTAMINTNRGLDEKGLVDLVYLKLNISMHQNTVKYVLERSRPAFKDTIGRFFHALGLEFGLKDLTPVGDENHLTTRLNPLKLSVNQSSTLGAITIMSYLNSLEYLQEQQSQGFGCMVTLQSNNRVVMPPTENLPKERLVLPHLEFVGLDYSKYWQIGEPEKLRSLQKMQPGETINDFEYIFPRVPRQVDGVWKTDFCRYSMNYKCFEFLGETVRISSSKPDNWEVVREATDEEVNYLMAG